MPKIKGIQSSEELREDLECPVCFVIPKSGPIYQCEAGHIHCKSCHPQLHECPVCRGPIGNMRSLMTEKIIAKLPTKCSFAEYGCLEDEKLPEEMLLHEKCCNFRLTKCVIFDCNKDVPVSDIVDHCRLKHDCIISKKDDELEWLNLYVGTTPATFQDIPSFVTSQKNAFAIYIRGHDEGYISIYVFIIGSQQDIDNEEYQCKIKLTNTYGFPVRNLNFT